MKVDEPRRREPAGAPSPLERQTEIESAPAVRAEREVEEASAAFHIRAPSMCRGRPDRETHSRCVDNYDYTAE